MNKDVTARYEEIFGDAIKSYSEKSNRQKEFSRKHSRTSRY